MNQRKFFNAVFVSHFIFLFFNQAHSFSSSKTFSKKPVQKRILSGQANNKGQTKLPDLTVNQLWNEVALFESGAPALYSLKENSDIIASVLIAQSAVSFSEVFKPKKFFDDSEKEKKALFQKLSIKDRKRSFSAIKQRNGILVLYSKGSYIDFKNKKALFEDWSFYHNKTVFHFLIHARNSFNGQEREAVGALFKDLVLLNKDLSDYDKDHFIKIFKEIKNSES